MHDERHGHERQQFIEHIQRQHIARERDACGHAEGYRVKRQKPVLPVGAPHILERIQRRKRPKGGNQSREHRAHAVQPQGEVQVSREVQEQQPLVRTVQDERPEQPARHECDRHRINLAQHTPFAEYRRKQQRPAYHCRQDGNNEK